MTILCAGVVLAVMSTVSYAKYRTYPTPSRLWDTLLPILLGTGIWFVYDVVERLLPRHLPVLFGWPMWIYIVHFVIASWFLATMRFSLGKSDAVSVWFPHANITFITFGVIMLGCFMVRKTPKIFAICCGGRV